MVDAIADDGGATVETAAIVAMAFGALVVEELAAGGGGVVADLRVGSEGIEAGVVCGADAMEPGAVRRGHQQAGCEDEGDGGEGAR